MTHAAQWLAPLPLWRGLSQEPARLSRPAILRFTTDRFIDDLANQLQDDPAGIAPWVITGDLSLNQVAHGHFYLIAATLACQKPSRPDHTVDVAREERVALVLRRLDGTGREMAWTAAPRRSDGRRWQPLDGEQAGALAATEELVALFPAFFLWDGRQRRFWSGLIPTASQETYLGEGGARLPKLALGGSHRYLLRCVYLPHSCGVPAPAVVSAASEPFALTPFEALPPFLPAQ